MPRVAAKKSKSPPRKPFHPEWPARKVATVTALAILGHSSAEIARILGDGTTSHSIRHQIARWGIFDRATGDTKRRVAVRMHWKAIIKARDLAEQMGIPLEVWAGRIVEFAARDGMYDAIVCDEGEAYREGEG